MSHQPLNVASSAVWVRPLWLSALQLKHKKIFRREYYIFTVLTIPRIFPTAKKFTPEFFLTRKFPDLRYHGSFSGVTGMPTIMIV